MIKAIGLFSGGLDSLLAIKLIQEQGIDVTAISFRSPFFIAHDKKKKKMQAVAKREKFKIHFIEMGQEYFNIIRDPPHGYGKNINPCIDCHAFMIKKAKEYGETIGAKFIFTGEVLDERPMSQNANSLKIVETDSGLKGKLLRPLSAKQLPETEAEKKGYVDREKLMNIRGKGRKEQFALAKKFKIKEFETPGGGCLLTYEQYGNKLKDLFKNKKKVSLEDIKILKTGRHFRKNNNKIIVGRNQEDNEQLLKLKQPSDYQFELKDTVGPITILTGPKTEKSIKLAAQFTISHSKLKQGTVQYGKDKFNKEINVKELNSKQIEKKRI